MSRVVSLLAMLSLAGLAAAQTPRAPGRILGAGYSVPPPLKVAPGQVITLFVHSPNGIQPERGFTADAVPLPTSINGFAVKLEQSLGPTNVEVPLFAVYPVDDCVGLNPSVCTDLTAITLQIPWELVNNRSGGGRPENFATLRVSYQGTAGDAFPVQPESDSIHIIISCDSTMPPGFVRPADLTGGCHSDITRTGGSVVRLQARIALRVELEPVLRVVIFNVREREPDIGGVWRQEPEDVAACVRFDSRIVFILGLNGSGVVDVSCEERAC